MVRGERELGASMRPGRFGPGDVSHPLATSAVQKSASMRPGRFGPGDKKREIKLLEKHYSFNEARALWPGRHDRVDPWLICDYLLQ